MTAFDETPVRKPFADLGQDIGDVNRHYARGEHPAERRAAAQHAEENERIYANVRPAMRTNNRLRNYMHFMHPLVQDRDNLDDHDGDAVDERYSELRSAGLANTLGGARANAMDRGEHLPQVRREDRALYRALPRGGDEPQAAEGPGPAMGVQGSRSLNLWQEGDPEPGSSMRPDPSFNGRQYLDMQDELLTNYVGKQGTVPESEFAAIDTHYRKGKMEGPQANQWGLMLALGSQHHREIDREQSLIDEGDDDFAKSSGGMGDEARRLTSRLAQAEVPGAPQAYDRAERAAKLAAFNARPGGLPEDSAPMQGSGRPKKAVRFADTPDVRTFASESAADASRALPTAETTQSIQAKLNANYRFRNLATFAAPLIRDRGNLSEAEAGFLEDRIDGMDALGTPRANAMDRGGHAPMDWSGRSSDPMTSPQSAPAAPNLAHLEPQTRRRAGGWANPMNWGWVKRMRNWFSGTSRVEAPGAAESAAETDAPAIDQMAAISEADQFRPAAAPTGFGARMPRGRMFGRMARRLSV